MSSRTRGVTVVVFALALHLPLCAQAQQREPRPTKITVEPLMQDATDDARARSSTIQRQWDTIERHSLIHVAILLARGPLEPWTRARTTMRRYSSGLLIAIVELPAGADVVELLAHELEHVIEQLEGVDLKALAARGTEAVRRDTGTFETKRAQAAGLTAAAEADAADAETRATASAGRQRPESSPPRRTSGGS